MRFASASPPSGESRSRFPRMHTKTGLVLDQVVLLGRTLDEYRRCFALELEKLKGRAVLDVASGVSSFCAEANALGLSVTAFDMIYELPAPMIQTRCMSHLEHILDAVKDLKTYRWDFYKSPAHLRTFREKAYRTFLEDYQAHGSARYVAGRLPQLPFEDGTFDLSLGSHLLLMYEDQLDYAFHQASLREIMRVTRGEARFYPIVNFEAKRSAHLDRWKSDPALAHLQFEEVRVDFEFLAGSTYQLRVRHR